MVNREGFDYWLMDKGIDAEQARWFLDRYAHRLAERQRAYASGLLPRLSEIDAEIARHYSDAFDAVIKVIDPGSPKRQPPSAA